MASTWDSMVTVGRIVRPHGLRGAVVVAPESDFAAERFEPGAEVHWQRGGLGAPVKVVESREYRGRWVISLVGVETMSDAETLRGLELRVPAESLRELKTGEFYVHDLRGCEVVTSTGLAVGRVERVDLDSGTPILAVTGERGEVLIPLAEEICKVVDTAGKKIVVDPPAGLIDLNIPKRVGDPGAKRPDQ